MMPLPSQLHSMARVMSVTDAMTDVELDREYEFAMDEIIKCEVIGQYAKIKKSGTTPVGKLN